jgi:hypothetical protein
MKQANWLFASTGGGYEEGINNTLTEHFEGDYNYYLAREIIQNSIDARDDKDKPVIVRFKLDYLNTSEFPGIDRFSEILRLCLKTHQEDIKTHAFFEKALQVLEKDKFPYLKISDFNTIGLSGADKERNKSWYSLVKSRGVSLKNAGEGGSFGLGKGAAFAASDLRTIFYSSTSKEDAKSRHIGISILVNFDEENDTKQSIGTYGLGKQETIYDPLIMGNFWRKEKGLDIYLMGYKVENYWKKELTKSVLRNFWYAIINEDLEVEIDGTLINFESLEPLLNKYFSSEPFKDYIEPKGNPLYYYKSILSNTAKKFETNLKHIGNVKFYFLPLEENMNYVAMMRKSHMIIYTKPFYLSSSYCGVFICDDSKGNEQLKNMEPPAHDKWDPERYKELGKKIMDEIEKWIRECLKSVKKEKQEEITEVPELEKYLPLIEESDFGSSVNDYDSSKLKNEETSKLISENQSFKVKSKIEPFKVSIINKEETGLGGSGVVVRMGTKKRNPSEEKAPGKGVGKNKAISSDEFKTRIFSLSKNFTYQEYIVLISSTINRKCNIKIRAIGEEGSEKVKIKQIVDPRGLNYKISNNCIHGFQLEKDKEIKFRLKLEDKQKCSLNLEAYEIQ